MINAKASVPFPINEPVLSYAPGTPERAALKEMLGRLRAEHLEIPLIIGGKEVRTGSLGRCILPHEHGTVIGAYHQAGEREVRMAAEAAGKAAAAWGSMDWQDRAAVFLKAADLLAGPRRALANASCMLSLSKSAFQAEIDSACETIDFLRFNCYYAMQVYEHQPLYSPRGAWNRMEYRPLEGFVFAVTPFNFVSIAANLPTAPAIMGNVCLWKPASNAVYPAFRLMQLLLEAGLPEGVINFLPGPGGEIGPAVMALPELAGIHFTGSTATFQGIWSTVGLNIGSYRSYPRLVGETGGKDFVFAHRSAGIEELGTALIRGAFEYQGQKCSAVSRAYIPRSIWGHLQDYLLNELPTIRMGGVEDFANFMNAVIDEQALKRIAGYIEEGRSSSGVEVLFGGGIDGSRGFFIQPTVLVTTDPRCRMMQEEIFGPVLTVYVYEDGSAADYEAALRLCDQTSPYGLTGAIFAREREALATAQRILVNAAGNFYLNDKPTGAVVGQQPFGGSRASGTNDKAGCSLNLLRWVSAQATKENFAPAVDYRYPFMAES
jgi:1-pyrroline-5-carboxylate dehydrogenase